MTSELDTLKMALLSLCAQELAALHAVHAHVEDWIARPLASDELERALGELEAAGLVAAYRRERSEWVTRPLRDAGPLHELRFRATTAGNAAAVAAWARFFQE